EVKNYVASAQAILPTQLLLIPNSIFTRILKENPNTAIAMLGSLSMRLHRRLNEIEILSLKNATHRVIRYLLSQGLRLCGDCNTLAFERRMPRRCGAGRLSMQVEPFSRIIHYLSTGGLLRGDGRLICILNREHLVDYE